ncbi:hypothetical protein QBC36DRAFT_104735 [Triangularia setosa]|uniref:Uncharacterized protein n=1 Tax=Triangularia setosa TaxID=2587417 RepID=A0AAN6WAJ5_9PEZI|nr:hypothetical protein QBC36DRAFT_104735 [Podospora setosa]
MGFFFTPALHSSIRPLNNWEVGKGLIWGSNGLGLGMAMVFDRCLQWMASLPLALLVGRAFSAFHHCSTLSGVFVSFGFGVTNDTTISQHYFFFHLIDCFVSVIATGHGWSLRFFLSLNFHMHIQHTTQQKEEQRKRVGRTGGGLWAGVLYVRAEPDQILLLVVVGSVGHAELARRKGGNKKDACCITTQGKGKAFAGGRWTKISFIRKWTPKKAENKTKRTRTKQNEKNYDNFCVPINDYVTVTTS